MGRNDASTMLSQSSSRKERGAALVLVLWAMALLALLGSSVLALAHLQKQASLVDVRKAQILMIAEAGISMGIQDISLAANTGTDIPSNLVFMIEGVQISVTVASEHGKLDLNFCAPTVFAQLLRYAGADSAQAERWSTELQSRREKGLQFEQLPQLLELSSLSIDFYHRLLPWVTLWSGRSMPDPMLASPELNQALGLSALAGGVSHTGSILSIGSTARFRTGEIASVTAVVLLEALERGGGAFQTLHWQAVVDSDQISLKTP